MAMAATHTVAHDMGEKLVKSITGNKGYTISGTPRLDYTARNGKVGIASAFKGSYNPKLFASRTKLSTSGHTFALVCESHKTSHHKCSNVCEKAVSFDGHIAGILAYLPKSKGAVEPKPVEPKPVEPKPETRAERIERKGAEIAADS